MFVAIAPQTAPSNPSPIIGKSRGTCSAVRLYPLYHTSASIGLSHHAQLLSSWVGLGNCCYIQRDQKLTINSDMRHQLSAVISVAANQHNSDQRRLEEDHEVPQRHLLQRPLRGLHQEQQDPLEELQLTRPVVDVCPGGKKLYGGTWTSWLTSSCHSSSG